MKLFMIIGGLLGFCLGAGFGIAQGCSWPALLVRACVAALVAGILLRWWGRIWIRGFHQAYAERLAAEENEETTKTTQAKS
jgi:hypothetical protein